MRLPGTGVIDDPDGPVPGWLEFVMLVLGGVALVAWTVALLVTTGG